MGTHKVNTRLSCVPASPAVWEQAKAFARACIEAGMTSIPGSAGLYRYLDNLLDWVDYMYTQSSACNQLTFFTKDPAVDGFVGVFSIRSLTADLLLSGGCNYGHTVRPDLRNRGYGREQLYLGMQMLAMLGQNYMLVGVESTNIASLRAVKAVRGSFLYQGEKHDIYRIPIWS